jgi:hypothetical protein
MSELDTWFPGENGIDAIEVMAQSRKGLFKSHAHYLEAKKQGLLPKQFTVKGAIVPSVERRYRNLRYR